MPLFIIFLAVTDLLFTLFAVLFVNWWAPLFAVNGEVWDRGVMRNQITLPTWLKWFDTFDAGLDAGLLPWQSSTYWTRMCWLYRNPAYGFSYWVLGAKFTAADWTVLKYEALDNKGNINFHAIGPAGMFNYNVIRFGLHWKIGWKAWNYFKLVNNQYTFSELPWGPEMRVPFTFSISLPK